MECIRRCFRSKSSSNHSADFEEALLTDSQGSKTTAEDGFGDKAIGFTGGIALLVNNITGPGMVTLPILFQQSGWLLPTLVLVFLTILSSLSATLLCKAMSLMPNNERFQSRYEMTTLAKVYFPRWGYYITHLFLYVSLVSLNISSIILSAQTADMALIAIFKETLALEFYSNFGFASTDDSGSSDSPFGSAYVISIGFIVVLALTIPMGYFNLDDNIFLQLIAFVFLFILLCQWLVVFVMEGLSQHVPVFTTWSGQSQVLGALMFNYAFVTSIPSWVNEKKEEVSVNKSIWSSTCIATAMFFFVGYFGALTFNFSDDVDILSMIVSKTEQHKVLHLISIVFVYLFPVLILLTSIPVFAIVIRYNFVENKIMGKNWANFWAGVFPWALSLVFYPGEDINQVIFWSSIIFNGVINFIIPLLIFVRAWRARERGSFVSLNLQDSAPHHEFRALPKFLPSVPTALVLMTMLSVLLLVVIIQNAIDEA